MKKRNRELTVKFIGPEELVKKAMDEILEFTKQTVPEGNIEILKTEKVNKTSDVLSVEIIEDKMKE